MAATGFENTLIATIREERHDGHGRLRLRCQGVFRVE